MERPPHVPDRPMSPREAEAYGLFLLAEAGAVRVRLRAGPEPPAPCRRDDGRTLAVEDAMRDPPIPHAVGPGERCACAYRPAEGDR